MGLTHRLSVDIWPPQPLCACLVAEVPRESESDSAAANSTSPQPTSLGSRPRIPTVLTQHSKICNFNSKKTANVRVTWYTVTWVGARRRGTDGMNGRTTPSCDDHIRQNTPQGQTTMGATAVEWTKRGNFPCCAVSDFRSLERQTTAWRPQRNWAPPRGSLLTRKIPLLHAPERFVGEKLSRGGSARWVKWSGLSARCTRAPLS